MSPRKEIVSSFFNNIPRVTLLYIILLLVAVGFALIESPNLHRIRAALIYREVDVKLIDDQNTGVIKAYKPPPAAIRNYALKLLGNLSISENTWKKGLALARIKRGSKAKVIFPPSSSAEKRFFDIINRGKGICSDYTEIYISLCLAVGIPAREWGITPDQLKGYGGHSLVEIYDSTRGGWGVIDPYISGWPSLRKTPDQSLGLLAYLQAPKNTIVWHPIVNEYYRPDLIKRFYEKRPLSIFIIGDQIFFAPIPMNISTPMVQLCNIMLGKSFHFFVPKIPNNADFVFGLRSLRVSIVVPCIATFLLFIYIIFKAIRSWKYARKNSLDKFARRV